MKKKYPDKMTKEFFDDWIIYHSEFSLTSGKCLCDYKEYSVEDHQRFSNDYKKNNLELYNIEEKDIGWGCTRYKNVKTGEEWDIDMWDNYTLIKEGRKEQEEEENG